jgi:hypothetical protein
MGLLFKSIEGLLLLLTKGENRTGNEEFVPETKKKQNIMT